MIFEKKENRKGSTVKKCCECGGDILVKFNFGTRKYSQVNNWYFGTGNFENKEKYKCNDCLLNLYYDRPQDYSKLVLPVRKQYFGHCVNKGGIVRSEKSKLLK